MLNIFLQNIYSTADPQPSLSNHLSDTDLQQHVSLNLFIVRNKDLNGLHPDTKGKLSPLGLKFPRNETDCPYCNRVNLLHTKKEKDLENTKNPQKF